MDAKTKKPQIVRLEAFDLKCRENKQNVSLFRRFATGKTNSYLIIRGWYWLGICEGTRTPAKSFVMLLNADCKSALMLIGMFHPDQHGVKYKAVKIW